jgi:hypothetical protein
VDRAPIGVADHFIDPGDGPVPEKAQQYRPVQRLPEPQAD